jgi:ABC-type branched-subunit amino acid transport system substrate-binding protein
VIRPGVRLAALALLGLSSSVAAAPAPIRLCWIGPLSGPLAKAGEESLLGVRGAAEEYGDARPVEVMPFDDKGDPKVAEGLLQDAQKGKFLAVVAMQTGTTVGPLAARARRGHLPVLLVGSAPPPNPTVDPSDPVFFVGGWPVDQALNLCSYLAIHSDKSGLGLYRDCMEPALVHEDTERGRLVADAIARNLGPRQHLSGRVAVPPGEGPAKEVLAKLRAARCDRLLLVGEPDLIPRTAEAAKAIGWSVPFFCADGMLSEAARAIPDGYVLKANFLYGVPTKAQLKSELPADTTLKSVPAEALRSFVEKRRGAGTPIYPRTRNGWFGAWLALRSTESTKSPGGYEKKPEARPPLETLRRLHYPKDEERECPYLDEIGYATLVQWLVWTMGESGPEPVKPAYLPTRDRGPPMRMKKAADWDAVAVDSETKVVWMTFGEKEPAVKSDPARTIEEDMAALGLGTMGYEGEMDPWLLEELQVRTLGKINRLFLKNYDGTGIPGVSYNIHFTFTKPEKLKPSQYWRGYIAGEVSLSKEKDPKKAAADEENQPGGQAVGNTAYIYSRWMRKYTAIKDAAFRPRMNRDDRKYLDGTYSWGTTYEENLRSDAMKCVLDGYASWFAMTGAHEFGHVAGCGHDTESSRSIMNVVDAVGLRDSQAHWIPMHVKALDTTLGRWGAGTRK